MSSAPRLVSWIDAFRLPDGRIEGLWLTHDGTNGELRRLVDRDGSPETIGAEVVDTLPNLERIYVSEMRELAHLGGSWRPDPGKGWRALRREHGCSSLPRDRRGRIAMPRNRRHSASSGLDLLAHSGYLLERLGPLVDTDAAWMILAVDGPDRAAFWDDRGVSVEPAPLFAASTLARFATHLGSQGPALFAVLAGRMEDGRIHGPLVIVDVLRIAGAPVTERSYEERRIIRDQSVVDPGAPWSVPVAESTVEGRVLFAISAGGWRISPLAATYADPTRPAISVRRTR